MDNLDISLEDIFINLSLVSKIEIGNKLTNDDKHINIDTSYFQSISRWFSKNSRTTNLQFINLILVKSFENSDRLLKEDTVESAQLLLRLNSELKNCIGGLTNLKQTYNCDKLIQSEIDVMIENIRSNLDNNLKSLNFKKKVD
jgi:hypothetical protein